MTLLSFLAQREDGNKIVVNFKVYVKNEELELFSFLESFTVRLRMIRSMRRKRQQVGKFLKSKTEKKGWWPKRVWRMST